MASSDTLYVYIDIRGNEPEVHLLPYDVFYVGQGNEARVKRLQRGTYHDAIAAKYGMTRIRVFQHEDPEVIKAKEVELIKQFNTYHYDNARGANFTRGGDGTRGHKWTARQRAVHQSRDHKHTDATKLKISHTKRGIKQTQEHRDAISNGLKGREVPVATRALISKTNSLTKTGRPQSPETRAKRIATHARNRYAKYWAARQAALLI